MIAALIVSLLAVFLGYLSQIKRYRFCFPLAFILISFFLGIRYMWGNDMQNYVMTFNDINIYDFNIQEIISPEDGIAKEWGWTTINSLCKPIGFLGMQILLVIFQNLVIYLMIKRYVPPKWYWFSIFIYCFTSTYMILSASMMRQFLAMCFFILAGRCIVEKKIIPYIVLIILAMSVHQSAIILLPCFILGYLDYNIKIKHVLILSGLYVAWYMIAATKLADVVLFLIELDPSFNNFEGYLGIELQSGTGLGVLFKIFLSTVLLMQFQYFNRDMRIYAILTCISLLFIPLSYVASLAGRIGYYFAIFSIITYPVLMDSLQEKKFLRNTLLFACICINLKGFIEFFFSPVWNKAYFEFHTIFEQMY